MPQLEWRMAGPVARRGGSGVASGAASAPATSTSPAVGRRPSSAARSQGAAKRRARLFRWRRRPEPSALTEAGGVATRGLDGGAGGSSEGGGGGKEARWVGESGTSGGDGWEGGNRGRERHDQRKVGERKRNKSFSCVISGIAG
jgi:hypothetical protein